MEPSAKNKASVDELFAEMVRQMNYAAQPNGDEGRGSVCVILRTKAKRTQPSSCDFFSCLEIGDDCALAGVPGNPVGFRGQDPLPSPCVRGAVPS
jgi:hypothetical protein